MPRDHSHHQMGRSRRPRATNSRVTPQICLESPSSPPSTPHAIKCQAHPRTPHNGQRTSTTRNARTLTPERCFARPLPLPETFSAGGISSSEPLSPSELFPVIPHLQTHGNMAPQRTGRPCRKAIVQSFHMYGPVITRLPTQGTMAPRHGARVDLCSRLASW